ncbi:MAG: PSD1 and planctomycete cytochrome C domain-containing protein [Planctomycetota bacterium]|nr:PSD1 and planctomycete cytochrome C domain-containing protein [Planctomycetota bacterium]
MKNRFTLCWINSSFFLLSFSLISADEIDFEKQIRPILENRCWHCHGEQEQESGLRLDSRPNLLRGGDSGASSVVPGQPEKSYLIEVINHLDPENAMPPDDDKLPQSEIDLLAQWVREGAIWPGQMTAGPEEKSDHWSFQPVTRPKPVPSKFESPVDSFLSQKLAQQGLDFSTPADPLSLIRRVSIVLTGIAPTPEEVRDFRTAWTRNSDQAYIALVDRLLDSEHFGERWAQHWLDVIRWAETNGSEANLYRKNAWVYRDYVTRAFNQDKAYDQFIREQLAGDSLGMGEATGFLVAGPHVPAATVGREPAAIRQARADRMDEIMQTVGPALMGITVGCARCHNHKFDPLTIRDYYSLTAVFQDIEFGSRLPELAPDHPQRKIADSIWNQIRPQRDQLRQMGGWEEDWGSYREFHFPPVKTGAVRFRFQQPNVTLDELEIFGSATGEKNLALRNPGLQLSGFPEIGGNNPVSRINDGEYGTMAWRARVEKNAPQKPWVLFRFHQPMSIDRIRMSNNREYFEDTDYLTQKPFLAKYHFELEVMTDGGKWKPWLGTWQIKNRLNEKHPQRKKILAETQRLIGLLQKQGPRPSYVGKLIRPAVTRILMRGSPENPREEVQPAGPAILNGNLKLGSATPGATRRLEFANWMVSSQNPLTARVMVNRIWHHVFGQGIVATTSDFGKAGARPTHPELLDWLAAEFMTPTVLQSNRNENPGEAGQAHPSNPPSSTPWSVKRMIRMLVLSRAFRQSSVPHPRGLERDATATLLWRYPPKRVEAEVIRDSILQASGVLDRRIGGPGYRIHNIKKTYAQWEVLDNHGPATWRRMLYQERMRRVDDRIFTAFDFPDCGQVRAKRPVSTTPLQALNLLNSPFVMDQTRRIAERAVRESGGGNRKALERLFELVLARQPSAEEITASLELMKTGDLAAVCRALINTNEFAFLP